MFGDEDTWLSIYLCVCVCVHTYMNMFPDVRWWRHMAAIYLGVDESIYLGGNESIFLVRNLSIYVATNR